MNEQHDESSAASQEQEQVRRLLAAAAGPTSQPPLPEDVAGRLDDVLAGLVAERETGPVPADEVVGVTELASRRRRRWPQVLVAAAAVSVLGIGLGNVVQPGQEEAMSTDAEAGSAAEEPRAVGSSAADKEGEAPQPAHPEDAAEDQDGRVTLNGELGRQGVPLLRTSSLTVDLQRIEDFALAVPVADYPRRWAEACVRPETEAGDEWLPVRLDGEEAVLLLRAPADDRRTAEVFSCDDGDRPAATTTVDAR